MGTVSTAFSFSSPLEVQNKVANEGSYVQTKVLDQINSEFEKSGVNSTEMEDKGYVDSWERVNRKQMFKQRQTLKPKQDLELENRFSVLEKEMTTNLRDSEEETKLDNGTLESKLPHRKLLKKQKGSRQKKLMGKLSDNLCGNLKENVNSTIQWQ